MQALLKAQREYRERRRLLERYEAGTPQVLLAAELKVDPSAVCKRIRKARQERRMEEEETNAA